MAAAMTELLGLEQPPVALAFAASPPEGAAPIPRQVPSACAFWREAEKGVFYAPAESHFNCPVGSMVMGFGLPDPVGEQLQGLVKSMCDQNYLSPDEVAKIPSIGRQSAGILYGPLAEFPAEPDLVLLWLTPAQAMIFNEAVGSADWTGALMEVSGRPGCTALALADQQQAARLSLGCMGMRTFTQIGPDRILASLPGGELAGLVGALERTTTANAAMESFYQGQAEQFA
jgi:uncharacterized protein (DUF169 family)